MNRTLRSVALSLAACAAALTVPSAATAAPKPPADGPIGALVVLAPLGGNPWKPGKLTDVEVTNSGSKPARGYFRLELPNSVEVGATKLCSATGVNEWVCGGPVIPAGGRVTYSIPLSSSSPEPVFGTAALGYVTGQDAHGTRSRRNDFLIGWPDKTRVRLAATEGATKDGRTTVNVKVTNVGTFAIGGYSLAVLLPNGVKVTDASCDYDLRLSGAGCEVYRGKGLKAGAVDSFTLTATVQGGPKKVTFYLTPVSRYLNKDTSVTLALGKATQSTSAAAVAAPVDAVPAAPVPTVSAAAVSGVGGPLGSASETGALPPALQRAGWAAAVAGGSAAVLAVSALAFATMRRRRVVRA